MGNNLEIKTLKVKDIHPYKRNPRKNDQAVDAVAESIRQCGYCAPIVVDENHEVLAGHTRLKAIKKLGWTECEVVIKEGLTDEQKRKYRLLDNKTNELAEWDMELLEIELDGLDFEGFDFGMVNEDHDWFRREEKDGTAREEGNDEYNEFLDKFEIKKTTDDCYTPDNIYNAVADWVADEYGLNRENFVRPFYPGGDYQGENYKKTDVVVDNPPFSILAEILRFYCEKGIRFFLFAPTLTLFSGRGLDVEYIPTGVTVVYENGASVNTSFVTNMGKNRVRSAPPLYKAVDAANDENLAAMHKDLPNYSYPDEVITAAIVGRWSKYGVDFSVSGDECVRIAELDEQKEQGKVIFGDGFLLSERAAAERAAAERAAAERAAAERAAATRWKLSEREKRIVKQLGSKSVARLGDVEVPDTEKMCGGDEET